MEDVLLLRWGILGNISTFASLIVLETSAEPALGSKLSKIARRRICFSGMGS